LQAQGKLAEAEAQYQQTLAVQPDHAVACCKLGDVLKGQFKFGEAVAQYRRALALNAGYIDAHNNLGVALMGQGKFDEAEACYRQALALQPAYAEVRYNLGNALRAQGKRGEAEEQYRQAVMHKPNYADAYNSLGAVLHDCGNLKDAVCQYEHALHLNPNGVEARTNLALALCGLGRKRDAVQVLVKGLAAQPENARFRWALAGVFQGAAPETIGEEARAILVSLCNDDTIATQSLSSAVIGLLKQAPSFAVLRKAASSGSDPFAGAPFAIDAFARDPLLLSALPRLIITDADLELVLTCLRRHILLRSEKRAGIAAASEEMPYEFVCALARQCFNTEYAFVSAMDEERLVKRLRTALKAALQQPVASLPSRERSFVLAALYDSLDTQAGWERLPIDASQWSAPFKPILREQLSNRQREREIAACLTAVTEVSDGVSQTVQQQYEENPYPRWVSLGRSPAMTVEDLARKLRHGKILRSVPRPVSVLVAGCGTGQHPIQIALALRDCEVSAVDLSRASLAYAARMAEQFGVGNIAFRQADILQLGKLERRFTLIECVGVLHHLRDPLEGWRVLVGLLRPEGLMKIGLYSERGRRTVNAVRDFALARGFPPTAVGIRRCRRAILELPAEHPARCAVSFRDFYSLSGFRDFCMHVQEHTFTIPRIAGHLKTLGLRFLGFDCDAEILGRFRGMFPGDNVLDDLACWEHFEEAHPDGFRSMYQFWCCRNQED
jgi:tetratricopeptide (TPR) repeat protein/SAM-dependent methyltransferase